MSSILLPSWEYTGLPEESVIFHRDPLSEAEPSADFLVHARLPVCRPAARPVRRVWMGRTVSTRPFLSTSESLLRSFPLFLGEKEAAAVTVLSKVSV